MKSAPAWTVQTSAVPLKEAAKVIGVDVSTLRRDIVKGCPTVDLGSVGRGNGTLVDIATVRQWRARRRGDVLGVLEESLLEFHSQKLYTRAKVTPGQAALIAVKVYEVVYERVKQEPLIALPEQMKRLCAICIESIECGQFLNSEEAQ